MIQRHKRRKELFDLDKKILLEALGRCRKAINDAHTKLDPWSRQYELGGPILKAIDDLATELTGDPHFFHAGSSTGP